MKDIKNNSESLECPLGGDETNNCESCIYSGEYSFFDGECIVREKTEYLGDRRFLNDVLEDIDRC